MSDLADWKELARRAVHDAMALTAEFQSADGGATATLAVRWHGKAINPDAPAGYAQTLDVAERVVFDRAELAAKSLDPVAGDTVTFPKLIRRTGEPLTLILRTREPYDGPVNLCWNVVRDI